MSDNEIPAGRYLAKVTEAVLSSTSHNEPQIAVGLEITDPPSSMGRLITYYGSLSTTKISKGKNEGKTVAELTFEALDACGWDGENFLKESLGTCVGAEVSIVVAHEADDRGTRVRVKFINKPNSGGAAVKTRATDSEATNVTKQFQAVLMRRKQQNAAKNNAQRRAAPPPGAGDAWEGPGPDAYDDLG